MKYLIPILFICSLTFSQTNDSIYNKKAKRLCGFNIKPDSLMKPNFDYKFKANEMTLFSVYDRNTKLNGIYFLSKDSSSLVKTVNLNSNQFIPKDSFNPNGTSNFKTGFIMGVANTVFKSFLK